MDVATGFAPAQPVRSCQMEDKSDDLSASQAGVGIHSSPWIHSDHLLIQASIIPATSTGEKTRTHAAFSCPWQPEHLSDILLHLLTQPISAHCNQMQLIGSHTTGLQQQLVWVAAQLLEDPTLGHTCETRPECQCLQQEKG
ncbi:hypothetical protein AV530_019560 [Patagioenas fasciata monilis]|uniref:Uncharacterized protein n=1 Tax=Patagioenas fasciata monilis TaxID=372326 RepID=A0A1V4JDS0_PATFA|nr:hypothetical protein AV530_019560 [Patagioenas fasciata monilis]